MTDSDTFPLASMAWWDTLLEDASAHRSDYEADGWEASVLHTADVTPLDESDDDRTGLSVLVPDDEFDHLAERLDETTVDRYDVYRTTVAGYVAFILAIETADDSAFLVPGYYVADDESAVNLFEHAVATGELTVYVRRLDHTAVELSLDEPELLAPPEDAGNAPAEGADAPPEDSDEN
jgi:hypothetical protein